MTQDYVRRKHAKRAWKKQGTKGSEAALAEDKAARQRRKKRQTRRLCQGPCYKPPELTEEDRKWNGKLEDDESDDDAAAAQAGSDIEEAVAAHKEQQESPAGKHAAQDTSSNKKKKDKKENLQKSKGPDDTRKEAKGGTPGLVKLSTGVNLLDPGLAAQQAHDVAVSKAAAKAAAAASGGQVVEAAALAPYPPLIRSYMLSQGFPEPTPIQEACWPALCAGGDLLGVAEPGSGKTLAYLLPAALQLQAAGHSATTHPDSPLCLVLAPTRELAQQVAATCRSLRRLTGLRTVCIYGGVPKEQQVELLNKKPHIVVGTPGRLLDLVDDGVLQLHPAGPASSSTHAGQTQQGKDVKSSEDVITPGGIMVAVLDEADKMLSLGFEPQLKRLHSMLLPSSPSHTPHPEQTADVKPKAKGGKQKGVKAPAPAVTGSTANGGSKAEDGGSRLQVMLFTATMPSMVEEAAAQWLQSGAKRVVISHSAASISKTITQVVQVCAEHKKPAKLLKHLSAIKDKAASMRNVPRVLIFANRIKTVRFLHKTLQDEGYRAVMLHGQRSQPEREEAMTHFRSGKSHVLVATDVAARGLDVRGLPYVVNYDFPASLATYVHRVGRTGRLAAYGHAYSFFTRNLAPLAGPIVDLLKQHQQALDPNLLQLAEAWTEAEARLGPERAAAAAKQMESAHEGAQEGGEDGEGEGEEEEPEEEEEDMVDARLDIEDLREGLGHAPAKVTKPLLGLDSKEKKKKKRVREEDGVGEGEELGSGGPPGMQQRLQKAKAAGQAEAQLRQHEGQAPAFIPSKAFTGSRKGYAFKLGPRGLGYYVDHPPKPLSKPALKQLVQKGKGPIVPIGPQHSKKRTGANRFGSSSDDDSDLGLGSDSGSESESDGEDEIPAVQRDAGHKKVLGKSQQQLVRRENVGQHAAFKQQQEEAAKVEMDDSSSEDDDGDKGVMGSGGKRKRKALPGRLRKKLAKQKASS